MADISGYLDIIAHEPKGRLVKQAIYDALNAINQQAELRPPAKREITIGEVLGDTGYLLDYEIGEITQGELGFSSDIQNAWLMTGTGIEYYEASSTSIYAANAGRLFAVTLSEWSNNGSPPTLTDSSSTALTWTQMDTFKISLSAETAAGNAYIRTTYPGIDFTIKSPFITSADQLPSEDITEGDIYINVQDSVAYAYISDEWVTIEAPRLNLLQNVDKRVTVWTAETTAGNGISVSASDSEYLTLGVFAVYGDSALSSDYRLCLRDQNGFYGVKRITMSNRTYQGRVASIANLPSEHQNGDMYYVVDEKRYYIWDDTRWRSDQTVYNSILDSVQYRESNYISGATKKIFVCLSMLPVSNFEKFLVPIDEDKRYVDSVTVTSADPCYMNAYYSGKPGYLQFPVFNYYLDDEHYFFLGLGSLAILPIEIGEREEPDDDQTD